MSGTKYNKEIIKLAKVYEKFTHKDTRKSPVNENEFSMIFKQLCQDEKIDFNKINLYKFDNEKLFTSNKTMGSLINNNIEIENEFVLKGGTKEGISEWGNMQIDIKIGSKESIIFIENKIGSVFTYPGKEYSTQMRRYLNYLKNINDINNQNKTLILLSSKLFFDKKWYLDSYLKSIDAVNTDIGCYCIYWEEVFEAIL